MEDKEWLAECFEAHRLHLQAVAYRMLGSVTEAEDAVQDTWERVGRAGAGEVENLRGWLTTIVARVCLNMLRDRRSHNEQSLEARVPDPMVIPDGELGPEEEALLADSVGVALQVVLDTLGPAERLAFVLHDMFDLPFEEIGPMVGRSGQAARQLASRARRRVHEAAIPAAESDRARQRAAVDAFFAAGRAGDFDALVAILDPDVVLRADFGPAQPSRSAVIRGAAAVARYARLGVRPAAKVHAALIDGTAGVVLTMDGRPFVIMAFTIARDKIVRIDAIGDSDRVARLAEPVLAAAPGYG